MNTPFYKGDRVSYYGRMGTVTNDADQFWVTATVEFDDEPSVLIQKDKGDLIVTERAVLYAEPLPVTRYVQEVWTEDGWRPTNNAW